MGLRAATGAKRGLSLYRAGDISGNRAPDARGTMIRTYLDQTGKGQFTGLGKYVDQSYLQDALKELPKR